MWVSHGAPLSVLMTAERSCWWCLRWSIMHMDVACLLTLSLITAWDSRINIWETSVCSSHQWKFHMVRLSHSYDDCCIIRLEWMDRNALAITLPEVTYYAYDFDVGTEFVALTCREPKRRRRVTSYHEIIFSSVTVLTWHAQDLTTWMSYVTSGRVCIVPRCVVSRMHTTLEHNSLWRCVTHRRERCSSWVVRTSPSHP